MPFEKLTPALVLQGCGCVRPRSYFGAFVRWERSNGRMQLVEVPEWESDYQFIMGDTMPRFGLSGETHPIHWARAESPHPSVNRWLDLSVLLQIAWGWFKDDPQGEQSGFQQSRPTGRFNTFWIRSDEGYWLARKVLAGPWKLDPPAPVISHKQQTTAGRVVALWAILMVRGEQILSQVAPTERGGLVELARFLTDPSIPLSWDESDLRQLHSVRSELLRLAPLVGMPRKPNPVPEAHLRAAASYQWVCRVRPDLVPERSGQLYSKEQWRFIRENGCPAYEGSRGERLPVPDFDTWKRQARGGSDRGDRPPPTAVRRSGKSVVRRSDL